MKLEITEKKQNPLLKREVVKFKVEHSTAPSPSRSDILEELSSELDVPGNLIVIEKIATPHGSQTAFGTARVYETEDLLKELEPEYLIERTKITKEKSEETKKETEESEDESEKGEE
ncbi:hypothetical protein AKJ57_03270 [candidate division MSBL1 archaeon SCGC-AAA259A05]|uniref:Small ribosomal subunit protein eS24 n=1 Tax=candidate division MSBL1 archaeon SCGC-AAA259A05 TaxID=1698259 RepID=A0A133U9K9_9EURY|nr:hypothetical protein AKJ57_03270 [candidate division MSBL1 archaeon SCGC-AAA259A05]